MKNQEEDILKRFLQDTFSDYEPDPNDSTWENIRKEIQPQQPNFGAGYSRFVVPVLALLLLMGGSVWDNNFPENKPELALNSTREYLNNQTQIADYQKNTVKKSIKIDVNNTSEKSEKIYVNKTTLKVESKVLPKVEKSMIVPTFSTILNEPVAKQNVQEYAVRMEEFVGMDDKSPIVASLSNSVNTDNDEGSAVVSVPTDHLVKNPKEWSVRTQTTVKRISGLNSEEKFSKFINPTHPSSDTYSPVNDAVVEKIYYVKPLEMLKNKDFVLIKNEINLPKITNPFINKDPRPIRRSVYLSVSVTPLQTYRILKVNSKDIQNLQTNNLFDAERNGWAFDLGITKPIGNKWNFRSSVSFLKMRQWAEYQVNTNIIAVRNANNYANTTVVASNTTEFIEQTRIESKTLQMIGLKADVQKFFRVSGRNRYFISGGSQLMVEPIEKQTNVFINASAGFQHLVNKDCFLTIEPTASYLLNNINDSKSLIQTNAYNVGLKVGVNFKVK